MNPTSSSASEFPPEILAHLNLTRRIRAFSWFCHDMHHLSWHSDAAGYWITLRNWGRHYLYPPNLFNPEQQPKPDEIERYIQIMSNYGY